MTPETAAARMQTLHRLWRARCVVVAKLKAQYTKIFDRAHGRFYYAYKGKSKLLPTASWRRPRYCGMRGYPRDILPIYTIDVAALIIQRKWRARLVRLFFWALARATYQQVFDPLTGSFKYIHRTTGEETYQKPRILGNQPWDPNYIPDWTTDDVVMLLRRLGMKQYVKKFVDYGVDGVTLLLLDGEDFDNLNVYNRVHIRRIQLEVAARYSGKAHGNMREEHQLRRERIRKAKMFAASAVAIQRVFRGHRAPYYY